MRERHGKADRPVPAHAEKTRVVEENNAGGACRIMGFAEERADHRLVAVRLGHGEAADVVEFARETLAPSGHRPVAQRGAALDDHPRGLALGVRIDDPHCAQSFAPRHDAYQERNVLNRRVARLSWDGLRTSKALSCKAYSSCP